MCEPKILLLDIETTPHKGYFFSCHKVTIAPSMIEEPSTVLCYGAKWLGEPDSKLVYRDWSDEDFIEKIYNMIDEADGVVHYNGQAFDMKHLNREFLLAGYGPPSDYKNIDLLTCVRSNFKFASNKLEWVSLQLGYEGKVQHRGIQLWFDCMAGDPDAWEEMKEYNIRDVILLEEMHNDLLPWIKGYPNHGLFVEDASEPVCTNCGSTRMQRRGTYRTSVREYVRYQCQDCGKWGRSRKQQKSTDEGVTR